MASSTENDLTSPAIAIVGMAGRFPGAASIEEFWQNLVNGVDSVSMFKPADLEVSAATKGQPGYIAARSVLPNVDKFDPAFFGDLPKRSGADGPAASGFSGMRLGGTGAGRVWAGALSRHDRCVCRLQHEHLFHAQSGSRSRLPRTLR